MTQEGVCEAIVRADTFRHFRHLTSVLCYLWFKCRKVIFRHFPTLDQVSEVFRHFADTFSDTCFLFLFYFFLIDTRQKDQVSEVSEGSRFERGVPVENFAWLGGHFEAAAEV